MMMTTTLTIKCAEKLRHMSPSEARRVCAANVCTEWGTWALVIWNDTYRWTDCVVFCDRHAHDSGVRKP